jgi:hypothetical protein
MKIAETALSPSIPRSIHGACDLLAELALFGKGLRLPVWVGRAEAG